MTESLLKKFLALTLFGCSLVSFGQNCGFLGTDIQGNEYQLKKNELIKTSSNIAGIFAFSNKILGTLTQIDVNNPLRPLLFYGDVQKLVITDNTLSKQNQNIISFEELGMYQITCIASSKMDNGIWLYDRELFQLVKIDTYLNRIIETGNLKQILAIENLEPVKMMEINGFLYMQCANNGILVFDIYGTYFKKIPLENIQVWNIMNEQLLYATNEKAFAFNLKTLEIDELATFPNQTPVWITHQHVYFCEKENVVIRNFKTE